MITTSTLFESELKKIIDAEIERLTEILIAGSAVADYAAYRHVAGQIFAYRRVNETYAYEANTKIEQRL